MDVVSVEIGDEGPDLLVIGLGPGEGDPSAVASNWTSRWGRRPRAVVLIETLRAIDRLRAGAAGVDAVLPVERMLEELPRYARVLAASGAPVEPSRSRRSTTIATESRQCGAA